MSADSPLASPRRWRLWSAHDDARLEALAAGSATADEIARTLERTETAIRQRLSVLGLQVPSKRDPTLTPDDRRAIVALHARGETHARIAAAIECTQATVRAVTAAAQEPAPPLAATPSAKDLRALDADLASAAHDARGTLLKDAAARWGLSTSVLHDKLRRLRQGAAHTTPTADDIWSLWSRADAAVARRARTAPEARA
jgi:hypothetical protein